MFVVVAMNDPPTALRWTPSFGLPPFDSKVAKFDPEANVPVKRFSALPVPLSVTSFTVRVPKLDPVISVPMFPVSPIVNPWS